MALKRPEPKVKEEGPNDHLGEEPIDAPTGYAPRVVQVPMNQNADVNPEVHAAKMEEKKQNAKSEPKVMLKKGASMQTNSNTGAPSVTLMKASGPGSRGGKIVRHTKGGKPVYESQAKKQAQVAGDAMHRWHDIADRNNSDYLKTTDNPEHHAVAAKQALHAAYFHHHAGDSVSAHDAMSYANHHRAQYEKAGHKSRTTTAVEKLHGSTAHEIGHSGYDPEDYGLAKKEAAVDATRKKKINKAITPSNAIGGNMSKNEVADLFKSELGATNAKHITNCVHCKTPLSRDDLHKGLGTNFVGDDNDNPHDGAEGSPNGNTPVRGVPGAKENDEIAPLLKGLKGSDAGDKEEYPISKSEMLTMGMHADDLDDGWYTITKSEMQKYAPEHLAYLVDRKTRVAKSMKPVVNPAKMEDQIVKGDGSRSTTDGPHGYSPRAGGVHGPAGEQLVQWSQGSDAEVAKFIEKSGGYGPGTDESVRTQGRGY